MDKKWYERNFRRAILDMHIADWDENFLKDYDPVKYAEAMAMAKIEEVLVVAVNCLGYTYWPTKVGHMHKGIKGRDVFGEVIQELHKRNIKALGYYNIWSRWAYDTHPEWRVRKFDGKGVMVDSGERFGLCCYNTKFADYVREQVKELCSTYDFDGFWNDMIGDFGHPCYCDSCKTRFKKETGKDMPYIIDWDSEDWMTLQQKRENWLADFAHMITNEVKKYKPDMTVAHQCTTGLFEWKGAPSKRFFEASDYLSGDFYQGAVEQTVVCKFLNSTSKIKPIDFMTSRCPDLLDHTTQKTMAQLKAQAYSAIANNAAFSVIDAIDIEGTINLDVYKKVGIIYEEIETYEPYICPNAEPCCDVAVLLGMKSMMNYSDNGKHISDEFESHIFKNTYEIARSLMHYNIPFNIISENNFNDLSIYQAVVLSDQYILDEKEMEIIRDYVKNGGNLYVSGMTTMLDYEGKKDNFGISDLLGVTYKGVTKEKITYVCPNDDYKEIFNEYSYTSKYPVMLHNSQLIVEKLNSVKTIATITLPYTPPRDANVFSSAISDPPGEPTNIPSIVYNEYGKGKVIYSAGMPEVEIYDAHRGVFINLLKRLLNKSLKFITNAYKPVEVTMFDNKEEKRYIINFLNYQVDFPGVPACDMNIKVLIEGKEVVNVYRAPDKLPIEYIIKDNYVEFDIPKVDIYSMFIIEYK